MSGYKENKKPSKVGLFFKKIGDYIKNTAWIQPLLIVVVIFVILFSLSGIAGGVGKGWKYITTSNKMETITFKEYTEKVLNSKEDEKMIFVFSQKTTDNVEEIVKFYKPMNNFLKSETYKNADYKIYNVNIKLKGSASGVKLDGVKYSRYTDTTLGLQSKAATNAKVDDLDYLNKLDTRIDTYYSQLSSSYSSVISKDLAENPEKTDADPYKWIRVNQPLVLWYIGGIETRISNQYTTLVTNYEKQEDFVNFMKNFNEEGEDTIGMKDDWKENKFDLVPCPYNSKSALKDAYAK